MSIGMSFYRLGGVSLRSKCIDFGLCLGEGLVVTRVDDFLPRIHEAGAVNTD
jgi:hypothetical protein